MKKYKFNKLLKQSKTKFDYEMILKNHLYGDEFLTNKQLNKVLKLRGKKEYPHYELIGIKPILIYYGEVI